MITLKNFTTDEKEIVAKVANASLEISKFSDSSGKEAFYLDIELQPLKPDDLRNQHVSFNLSDLPGSALPELAMQLDKLGLMPNLDKPSPRELADAVIAAMKGKVFRFTKKKIGKKSENEKWFPIELVG